MLTCTITGRCVDAFGSAAKYAGNVVTIQPLSSPFEEQQSDGTWAEVGPNYLSANIDSSGDWSLQPPRPGSQSPISLFKLTTPIGSYTGFIPDQSGPVTLIGLLAGSYGVAAWTILSATSISPGTAYAPPGPAMGTTYGLMSLANQLLSGSYSGSTETCTTVFNSDGSITETWAALGLTHTTTFNGDGSITETVTITSSETAVHSKTTTFNGDGSITETYT